MIHICKRMNMNLPFTILQVQVNVVIYCILFVYLRWSAQRIDRSSGESEEEEECCRLLYFQFIVVASPLLFRVCFDYDAFALAICR